VTDDLEPIAIDDRSGAERIAATGRAGLARLDALANAGRIDVAALLWMLCTITYVGSNIYTYLHLNGSGFTVSGWDTVSSLAATGGPNVAVLALLGIGLAFWFDSSASRLAVAFAMAAGAWVAIAGIFGIASVLHTPANDLSGGPTFDGGNRVASTLGAAAFVGLGLLVVLIAWSLVRMRRSPAVS
jgi:hypothetical protein